MISTHRPRSGPRYQQGRGVIAALVVLTLCGAILMYWYWTPAEAPTWIRDYLPGSASSVTLYRWRDAEGRWQLADTPPEGVPFETVEVHSDANVIPAPP